MSSHLACLGMAVTSPAELDDLIERITQGQRELIGAESVETYAWQDDSGVRMIYDLIPGRPLILPSFAARHSHSYLEINAASAGVARVSVLGEDGDTVTGVSCELEQRRHLSKFPARGQIRLVALGLDVRLYPSESAFLASPDSLMDTIQEGEAPPPEVIEQGWSWPPRLSARAFFSDGFYDDDEQPQPLAAMAGVVLSAEEKVNGLTGQRFFVLRTLSAFGELDVCLAASEHDWPSAGQVVAGTVSLVGSLASRSFAVVGPDTAAIQPTQASPPAAAEVQPHRIQYAQAPRAGESRRDYRERTGRY